jgi:hypothetical protein
VFRKSLTPPPDYYKVTLAAGQTVTFSTSTPGDGPGQPVNLLDPHLELYSASQTLVAVGVTLADGRNEAISYTAPTSGTYYVKVSAQNYAEGDYVLDPVETGGESTSRDWLIGPGRVDAHRSDVPAGRDQPGNRRWAQWRLPGQRHDRLG